VQLSLFYLCQYLLALIDGCGRSHFSISYLAGQTDFTYYLFFGFLQAIDFSPCTSWQFLDFASSHPLRSGHRPKPISWSNYGTNYLHIFVYEALLLFASACRREGTRLVMFHCFGSRTVRQLPKCRGKTYKTLLHSGFLPEVPAYVVPIDFYPLWAQFLSITSVFQFGRFIINGCQINGISLSATNV
jgi:hypothetical protein